MPPHKAKISCIFIRCRRWEVAIAFFSLVLPLQFLPLKLLTALLWHQSALFPRAQVWKRKCWPHWAREGVRERVCQQHQTTYFRFCGKDQFQVFGQWVAAWYECLPHTGRVETFLVQSRDSTTQPITGKISPKPFMRVCSEFVSIALTLKLTVSTLIRSTGRYYATIFDELSVSMLSIYLPHYMNPNDHRASEFKHLNQQILFIAP